MYNKNELGLVLNILSKSNVDTVIIPESKIAAHISAASAQVIVKLTPTDVASVIPKPLKYKSVYTYKDAFSLNYTFFLLKEKGSTLVIGPYLNEAFGEAEILSITEKNGISEKHFESLKRFYSAIPTVAEGNNIFVMISGFCERLFDDASYLTVNLKNGHASHSSPINEAPVEDSFDDMMSDMKAMEKRYKFENELIRAVTLGQSNKEALFYNSMNDLMFEKRASDPLRNSKNYCVIMNTLLRKAAESGGVHPVYIDKVSSNFAKKIEGLQKQSSIAPLMKEIFVSYCELVKKHTMTGYSELIKTTVLLIDSDISAQISTSSLAKAQNVSIGYLSALFRKETGKTLTEFVNERRMNHAMHLLTTTELQIQSVALRCGIPDLQYFSKLFKRFTGKTPKEYRSKETKLR